jgi:hypothetical protein
LDIISIHAKLIFSFRPLMSWTSFSRSLGMDIYRNRRAPANSNHQAGNHRVIDMAVASSLGRAICINEIGLRIVPIACPFQGFSDFRPKLF